MRSYRRVLALVAITADSEGVARRAVELARFCGATLAMAAVVDYSPGFECDHAPFLTPEEMRQAIAGDVRDKLDRLVAGIGYDGGCEIIVACGAEREVVPELTRSWQPDLVLVGSRAPHGLEKNVERTPYDVLIVQNGRRSFAGRLINALAAGL